MTPDQAKASYQRQLEQHGEQMILRRQGIADAPVRGRIVPQFAPGDLVGSVQQIGRKAIITTDDMAASKFPLPLVAKADRLMVAGAVLTIMSVDTTTRRIAGVLIAYELELKGA